MSATYESSSERAFHGARHTAHANRDRARSRLIGTVFLSIATSWRCINRRSGESLTAEWVRPRNPRTATAVDIRAAVDEEVLETVGVDQVATLLELIEQAAPSLWPRRYAAPPPGKCCRGFGGELDWRRAGLRTTRDPQGCPRARRSRSRAPPRAQPVATRQS